MAWKKILLEGDAGGTIPTPICLTLFTDAAAKVWTNMPATLTEFIALAIHRSKLDLTGATQARLVVRQTVAGATNAKLKVQYSTDESTWVDICLVAVGTGVATKAGAWTDIPAGAKADVFIRLTGIDGDGAADPAFGLIVLQVK